MGVPSAGSVFNSSHRLSPLLRDRRKIWREGEGEKGEGGREVGGERWGERERGGKREGGREGGRGEREQE